MKFVFEGRAWVFPDNVDTDQITPGKYLAFIDAATLGKHVLEGARSDFPQLVRRGDILVAGRNFGCGSSREHAPVAIQGAGIPVVVAESFARIFYRNSFNVGLPLLVAPDVRSGVVEGDRIRVNLREGVVENLTQGKVIRGEPLSGKALELLEAGGLVPLVRKKLEEQRRGSR